MDLWTFRRYRAPELDVDMLEVDDTEPLITLGKGVHRYSLAVDNPEAARQIAADMLSLNDKTSPHWNAMLDTSVGEGWGAIGEFLDQRSLIAETGGNPALAVATAKLRLAAVINGTSQAIRESLQPASAHRFAEEVRAVKMILEQDSVGFSLESGKSPFDPSVQPNFFRALLLVEFEYFRRQSQLTLRAVAALLAALEGDIADCDSFAINAETLILYDLSDLEAHLWLVGHCLTESVGENAERFRLPARQVHSVCSGIEFMRQIELRTRETLRNWGENPYVIALDALGNTYSPLIAGPFIEQYHVTRRFVEIIAPMLSKRLVPPLRRMMFQYYAEEVGHEALESTTCEALGVSPSALEMTIPLPGHFGFVDVLTLVAILEPVASFASIMVIEGVFGEPPKMSLRLAAVARTNPAFSIITDEHEELNEDLNHNSISRNAFEQIDAISADIQTKVDDIISFLLELNQRAWGGIVDFYGTQESLELHGPMGMRFSPVQPEPENGKSGNHRQDARSILRGAWDCPNPPPVCASQ